MHPISVLLIEDNPMNMELASDLLEANGIHVLRASAAEEGIRLARTLSPDLILMDWSLPGMDGLCAARILKADARTADVPIVALTAHAMRGDREIALEAGCIGYLTKPINTRNFVASVLACLDRRPPTTTPAANLAELSHPLPA